MRKLAEGSAASAERVAELLLHISQASASIGVQMTEASAEVREGVRMSAEAEAALLEASAAFREVAGQIIDVSATAEQLSAAQRRLRQRWAAWPILPERSRSRPGRSVS